LGVSGHKYSEIYELNADSSSLHFGGTSMEPLYYIKGRRFTYPVNADQLINGLCAYRKWSGILNRWMHVVAIVGLALSGIGCWSVGNDDFHYSKRVRIVGFPDYKPVMQGPGKHSKWELKQTLRILNHSYANLTPASADKTAREFSEQGFTIVLSESNRYLFKDSADEILPAGLSCHSTLDQIIKDNRLLSDACHRHGLKFYLHQTSTMVSENLLKEHPDWAAIDLETGKTIINSYGTALACINNDEFMAEFFKRLERLIVGSKPDGLMQDEIQFFSPTLCGCKYCKEKFKRDTGYDLPEPGKLDGWLYHFADNVNYLTWLNWRRAKVVERMHHVRELLMKYVPNGIHTNYMASNSTSYCYYGAGLTLEDSPKFADVPGYECEPPDMMYRFYNPLMIGELKHLRAVAERDDSGSWTLSYDRSAGDYLWNWYLQMCQGSRRWLATEPEFSKRMWPPMVRWERDHEKLLGGIRAAGNIAVLYSLDSRDRNSDMSGVNSWANGYMSTCHALTQAHLPYKVILDDDIISGNLNSSIKTLLLFNAGSLSDVAVARIKAWVKAGGVLVASAETSLYNEKANKRPDFGLADVFGASYDGLYKESNSLVIRGTHAVTGLVTGIIKHDSPFVKLQIWAKDVEVVGAMRISNGNEYPGILARKYGMGKVIYYAGHPEIKYLYYNYGEPVFRPGEVWKDNRDPRYRDLICAAAVYGNAKRPLEVHNLPAGIIAEAYNHKFGTMKGVQVHLANFLGGEYKGGLISPLDDINFPDAMSALPSPGKPIVITVEARDVKSVYVISPDFDGAVKMPFASNGNRVTVELPTFCRYSIIYFSMGDETAIKRSVGGKILSTIPAPKPLIVDESLPLVGVYNPNDLVVFADSGNMTGGMYLVQYQGEICQVAYGSKSQFTTVTASIDLKSTFKSPVLNLGALDDNQLTSKCPFEIKVNGKILWKGTSDYPDDAWLVKSYPIPADWLNTGRNTVEITNTSSEAAGNCPWLAVNFVKIKEK